MSVKKSYNLIKLGILMIFIFNIIDYFFTRHALKLGYIETNAFMNLFVGTVFFPVIKLGLAFLFFIISWKYYQLILNNRYIFIIFMTCLGTYSGLMIYFLSLKLLGYV